MLKKVLLVFVIIIAFLLASVYIFRANIKKYAITTILKSFPLPNVALANVSYDETAGKLKLQEIKVKNPDGFRSKHLMEASTIDMDISFTTKPDLRLAINNLNVTDPVFYAERAADGKWNFLQYAKKGSSASLPQENRFGFGIIKNAFAKEDEKKSEILFPKSISINNGVVYFIDDFVAYGETHNVNFYPLSGTIVLDYLPQANRYERIRFDGSCNIDGSPRHILKGNLEIYPKEKNPPYTWEFNAYNVPLSTIKPYLDRYTPFIVTQGSFNMASDVKSDGAVIEGNYTMEFMDLEFAINPRKTNIPFLQTSVKKLSLYLTNQRGNVVIDFRQQGRVGEETRWSLGPITKRAIGLMAIDTVIDVIEQIEKGEKGGIMKEALPGDIPPEVIDIFRGILR